MRKAIFFLAFSLGITIILFKSNNALAQTNFRFTGQELDQSAGLYYFNSRYYQPTTGQFTQPDPLQNYLVTPELEARSGLTLEQVLANPQRLNAYSYSLNNPVNVTDPTGEVSKERQSRFEQISEYIRHDDNYWEIRDRDGNSAALNAIWQRSLALASNNVGDALDTFFDAVNINWRDQKTLDQSREDYLERYYSLPTALAGEYGQDRSHIDKLQHFIASARMAYKYSPRIAGLLGRLKEIKDGFRAIFDTEHGGYQELKKRDEGYSRGDIIANQVGIFWLQEYKASQINPGDVINNLY